TSFGGGLLGYIMLALASVGYLVRRDLPRTLERLGVKPIPASHLAIVAIGVVALYGLNAGGDWVQHRYFPDLWDNDHRMSQAIAQGLSARQTLLLGLSAGIGEE